MSSNKLAMIATLLCLAGGVGAATAFANEGGGAPSSQSTNCTAQNGQQGVDEQGTATDVSTAADEVEQEAENDQADDEAGDQQGSDDQSDEQGENDDCEAADDSDDDESGGGDD
jgi:hypothetical protein